MPQYWLKPFGTTEPPRYVDELWTVGLELDAFDIETGPATPRKPPQMGGGDKVLFHAVGHVRLYAAGELLGSPRYDPNHSAWSDRFPWVYPVRVDLWVPNLLDGPRTTGIAPARAMGHLQTGGPYARLTSAQYGAMLATLAAAPTVRARDVKD
jgi:hypothetical protein